MRGWVGKEEYEGVGEMYVEKGGNGPSVLYVLLPLLHAWSVQSSRPHSRSSKRSSLPSTKDPLPLPPPPLPHHSTPNASSTDPLITSDPRLRLRSPHTTGSVTHSNVLPQEVGGTSAGITGFYSYPGTVPGAQRHSVEDATKPAKHTANR